LFCHFWCPIDSRQQIRPDRRAGLRCSKCTLNSEHILQVLLLAAHVQFRRHPRNQQPHARPHACGLLMLGDTLCLCSLARSVLTSRRTKPRALGDPGALLFSSPLSLLSSPLSLSFSRALLSCFSLFSRARTNARSLLPLFSYLCARARTKNTRSPRFLFPRSLCARSVYARALFPHSLTPIDHALSALFAHRVVCRWVVVRNVCACSFLSLCIAVVFCGWVVVRVVCNVCARE
jgi:hypothetical protein